MIGPRNTVQSFGLIVGFYEIQTSHFEMSLRFTVNSTFVLEMLYFCKTHSWFRYVYFQVYVVAFNRF